MSAAVRITLLETFGLDPIPLRAREAWLAIRGDASVPPTRFGLSSLGIFHPALSLRTWLGARRTDRRVPISCLFNRTPTPLEEGWSVRKTQVADYRGGTLTYDSHNGTDFAVPVGTLVVAAAPGRVLRISSEFNRGGLKVFIDHGGGLVTTSNHLARSLVRVGDVVTRGEPIAYSGYSGIDALVSFPWSVPHVHFNVWLDGEYVDPFAAAGETSLWTNGNEPRGSDGSIDDDGVEMQTEWDARLVEAAIAGCKEPATRDALRSEPDLGRRAMNVLFMQNYYPTRFEGRATLYRERHVRTPRLTLPFRAVDFDGIAFAG
jgi:murein DD-endopeptidase